jgi:transcriptional regulator with XRE-family HTH domain
MNTSQKLLQIRNKKLGLLIMDARRQSRHAINECAEAIGVSAEQFEDFEKGNRAPSMPQLELLALFFNLPIEHFWGKQALSTTEARLALQEKERLVLLRNRVIVTNLRIARSSAGISIEALAEKSGISLTELQRFEAGELAIPVTALEVLANALDIPIERFYDEHGPIGKWRIQQGSMQKFLDLPPEVQQFIAKPVNRPYLELAMRLSDLSAEKLRAVAEVLLEITY